MALAGTVWATRHAGTVLMPDVSGETAKQYHVFHANTFSAGNHQRTSAEGYPAGRHRNSCVREQRVRPKVTGCLVSLDYKLQGCPLAGGNISHACKMYRLTVSVTSCTESEASGFNSHHLKRPNRVKDMAKPTTAAHLLQSIQGLREWSPGSLRS